MDHTVDPSFEMLLSNSCLVVRLTRKRRSQGIWTKTCRAVKLSPNMNRVNDLLYSLTVSKSRSTLVEPSNWRQYSGLRQCDDVIGKTHCRGGGLPDTAGHSIPHNYPFIVYLSTKHAITALTTGLRREITDLGSHIKVTSLSPGTVKTEIMYRDNTTTVNADQVYSKHPYLVSEDVADALVYVLSTPPHVQIPELTITPVGEKW
uniref:(California timema) hypothetical protein n=1 Tax=Timema californicum TaxID=61474 RepID=A0A7R9J9J5_TIMCA|nr:unnamed protein product [Timema californicum]